MRMGSLKTPWEEEEEKCFGVCGSDCVTTAPLSPLPTCSVRADAPGTRLVSAENKGRPG